MTAHESAHGHHSPKPSGPPSATPVVAAIVAIALAWGAYTAWQETHPEPPFDPTRVEAPRGGSAHSAPRRGSTDAPDEAPAAVPAPEHETPQAHDHADHGDPQHPSDGEHHGHPPFWAVIPFALLLGAIAVLPLLESTMHWWEDNLHRFYVAGGLAIVTLAYYFWLDVDHGGLEGVLHVLDHAILEEYIPFIVLLFSLFTISGGIRISGDLPATPSTNLAFITVGGLLASFIGTTGAAMLLVRPLLETNAERKNVAHTMVFFIFVVCNCGGCLLPIGDPPLFLGYLKGVDFLWTMHELWAPWLVTNGILLAIYFLWDTFVSYPQEKLVDRRLDDAQVRPLAFEGLAVNVPLLIGVVLAVALLDPSKPLPLIGWKPYPFLREIVQLGLVAFALLIGSVEARARNNFNYNAIIEVAALFIGIFITMQPALAILESQGGSLGIESPMAFFWATGGLSAVLDNAPTYLVFYQTANAQVDGQLATLVDQTGPEAAIANMRLIGISLGAVFLGAVTYIGNGPNFMVRSIAEEAGVKMPSFFGYCLFFSFPVLLPVFAFVSWLFLA